MADHLVALLQWRDTDTIHQVDLTDGTETRHTGGGWQESLDRIATVNHGKAAPIVVSDDGVIRLFDFDGKDTPFPAPFFQGNIWDVVDLPGQNLLAVYGYGWNQDHTSRDEQLQFIDKTSQQVVRTVGGSLSNNEFQLDFDMGRKTGCAREFQGKFVFVGWSNNDNAVMLVAYDARTHAINTYALPGLLGDRTYSDAWHWRVNNGKLWLIPSTALDSLTQDQYNVFEVGSDWSITSHLVTELDGNIATSSNFGGQSQLQGSYRLQSTDSPYVVYYTNYNNVQGTGVRVLNLTDLSVSDRALAVPAPSDLNNVDLSTIQDANTQLEIFDKYGVMWITTLSLMDGSKVACPVLLVWDVTTGNLIASKFYTLDSADGGNKDNLWLYSLPVYKVTGQVRMMVNGTPTPIVAKVEMLDEETSNILGVAQSGADGVYKFRCYTTRSKTVLATHPTQGYRLPASLLVPTLE